MEREIIQKIIDDFEENLYRKNFNGDNIIVRCVLCKSCQKEKVLDWQIQSLLKLMKLENNREKSNLITRDISAEESGWNRAKEDTIARLGKIIEELNHYKNEKQNTKTE